jgi:hypothetical protein
MTLTQLAPPYPIFTDRDGSPLDAGYLYFGEANQNPETNPIQVYYDSALTIPAAQPLRTSNGYVMRNGSPALVYADGQFSVTIRNKRNELVIYSPVGYGILPGTSSTGTDQMVYNQGGTSAVTRVLTSRLQDYVSVKDFGAVGDGVTDDTAAFTAAQQASKFVWVPPGSYVLTALRIYNKVNLIGSGYRNTQFLQGDPARPAIDCLSDAAVGQLLDIRLENFGITGHASATAAAVRITALGVFAIYRGHFDFIIENTYQALYMDASSASNVFYCTFQINVVGTQTTSVVLDGGVYNTYDFFIVASGNGRCMQHSGFNNTFIRLVTDGQIFCNGQNTVFIGPSVEEMHVEPAIRTAIILQGFNQTLILPTIILNPANSTKIDHCIRPFSDSLIINPRFLVTGVPHPFTAMPSGTKFSLQGPGQNTCTNKMEAIYNGTDDSRDLRLVGKVGDVSAFISGASTFSGKTTQYLAPAAGASINHRILSATDAMIFEPVGTVTLINMSLSYAGVVFREGQTISVYTTQAITTINWNGNGSDVSLLPASMTLGQTIQFVYRSANNKWYPIGA